MREVRGIIYHPLTSSHPLASLKRKRVLISIGLCGLKLAYYKKLMLFILTSSHLLTSFPHLSIQL